MAINIGPIAEVVRSRFANLDPAPATGPYTDKNDFIFTTDGDVVEEQRIYQLSWLYRDHENVREYPTFDAFDSAETVKAGVMVYNQDSEQFYINHKETWKKLNLRDSDEIDLNLIRVEFAGENYGFSSGGTTPSPTSSVERFPFATSFTTGIEVSDLTANLNRSSAQSSATHAYTAGGYNPSPASFLQTVQKFSFVNMENSQVALDLGTDLVATAGHSFLNYGRGVVSGGGLNPQTASTKEYLFANDTEESTIQNLAGVMRDHAGLNSTDYLFYAGGYNTLAPPGDPDIGFGTLQRIRRIRLFTSPGIADTSPGNLTAKTSLAASVSSPTDGYVIGGFDGSVSVDTIQKFPFTSPGGATNVGTISVAKRQVAGQTGTSAAHVTGGFSPANNQIEKFPYASTPGSTTSDIGDLVLARFQHVGHQY